MNKVVSWLLVALSIASIIAIVVLFWLVGDLVIPMDGAIGYIIACFVLGLTAVMILLFNDEQKLWYIWLFILYGVAIGGLVGGTVILVNCIITGDLGWIVVGMLLLHVGLICGFSPWVNGIVSMLETLVAVVFLFIWLFTFSWTNFLIMVVFGVIGGVGMAIASAKLSPPSRETSEKGKGKEASVAKYAFVGYVIGGPAGAVVGAIAAADHNNRMKDD